MMDILEPSAIGCDVIGKNVGTIAARFGIPRYNEANDASPAGIYAVKCAF